jgi:hypothetical protein
MVAFLAGRGVENVVALSSSSGLVGTTEVCLVGLFS